MDHTGFATAQGGVYFQDLHCSGSRVFHEGSVPSGPWIAYTSQVSATQVLRGSARAHAQMGYVFCALPRS